MDINDNNMAAVYRANILMKHNILQSYTLILLLFINLHHDNNPTEIVCVYVYACVQGCPIWGEG